MRTDLAGSALMKSLPVVVCVMDLNADFERLLPTSDVVRCALPGLEAALSNGAKALILEAAAVRPEFAMLVPTIALGSPANVPAAIRAFRAGAVELCSASQLSEALLADVPPQQARVHKRFLAWAARHRLSGLLAVLPGTPLEGTARFDDGALQSALFCGLSSEEALQEMLSMDDAEAVFAPSTHDGPAARRLYAPRVLIVEDDHSIRAMLARVLEREGYRVLQASDGVEGWEMVQRFPLDLVLSDIDMPRLDGWGLLRYLRGDLRTRELPVVLLSAYEDMVMTLKAAKAGARAYLKKTGRSRELLDAVALLTGPRQRAWVAARNHANFNFEVKALGAAWVLELLGELDCQGRMMIDDATARYEVVVREGRLIDVTAQAGSLRSDGPIALEAYLTCHGRGSFRFEPTDTAENAPFISEVLERVAQQLSLEAAQRQDEVMGALKEIHVDRSLFELYARVASAPELKVLEGLNQGPATLDALATHTGLAKQDVKRMVGELLRRGVLVE